MINFDLPNDIATFIQRCGRTGRTHEGTAVSFYYEYENRYIAKDIVTVIEGAQQQIPRFLLNKLHGESFQDEEQSESYDYVDNANDGLQKLEINDASADDGWD